MKLHFWKLFLYFKSSKHDLIILWPSLRDINHHVGPAVSLCGKTQIIVTPEPAQQ